MYSIRVQRVHGKVWRKFIMCCSVHCPGAKECACVCVCQQTVCMYVKSSSSTLTVGHLCKSYLCVAGCDVFEALLVRLSSYSSEGEIENL